MMAKELIILSLFLVNAVHSVSIPDDLILTLPDGKIQGATYSTSNNKVYYGFRGIPYAIPPLGDLRFVAPQAIQPWDNIKNATEDGKSCISSSYFDDPEAESEDCLYINVYIPTLNPEKKLPVMFWIYGGKFILGNSLKSNFGPDFLIEEDVIVVTFNYRVGPFGFISTVDSALPGNYGLKDQNLALKWTNKNIEYFGGDPENVIIFGQSAGGISVGMHMVSQQSTGLFKGGILQSGSALMPTAVDKDPVTTAFMIGDALPGGNYGNDTNELKTFLQAQSVDDIMKVHLALTNGRQTWPVIEPKTDDAFLTESPYVLLSTGQYNKVPIMIGICAEEALMNLESLENAKKEAILYDTLNSKVIPSDLFPNVTDEETVVKEIKAMYLNEGETFATNLTGLVELFTDDEFARSIMKYAQLTISENPVYFYQFSYYGRATIEPYIDGAEKAAHAAELPFLFNLEGVSNTTDPQDLLTQNRMVKLWTNFAKYLKPTLEESKLLDNVMWTLFDVADFTYMNINGTLEIRKQIKQNTRTKWDYIYDTYGRKPFVTF